MHHFPGKFEVSFGALGFDIVMQDGFAVAWSFGKSHVSRDDSLEHMLGETAFRFVPLPPRQPVQMHA